jgi:hypothetical protein
MYGTGYRYVLESESRATGFGKTGVGFVKGLKIENEYKTK